MTASARSDLRDADEKIAGFASLVGRDAVRAVDAVVGRAEAERDTCGCGPRSTGAIRWTPRATRSRARTNTRRRRQRVAVEVLRELDVARGAVVGDAESRRARQRVVVQRRCARHRVVDQRAFDRPASRRAARAHTATGCRTDIRSRAGLPVAVVEVAAAATTPSSGAACACAHAGSDARQRQRRRDQCGRPLAARPERPQRRPRRCRDSVAATSTAADAVPPPAAPSLLW